MAHGTCTIESVLRGIACNEYLLPVIQRDFVWTVEQIENLFDSIMSGYPINSMLFWTYRATAENQYKFYEFLNKYDEYSPLFNKEHTLFIGNTAKIVLDGQQRLTSLNVGLNGYMNLKKLNKRRDNADNYEKNYLYIDLLYNNTHSDDENVPCEYCFRFKTDNEVIDENNRPEHDHMWFKMAYVLHADSSECYEKFLPEWFNDLDREKQRSVDKLLNAIYHRFNKESVLNYYEEITDDFDRVLQIFVRTNNGGTPLGYTDLLLSMIANVWSDAREEIKDVLNTIDKEFHFKIPKDIFLRACLYLTDEDLNFKVKNFGNNRIKKIQDNFDEIKRSMRGSTKIFNRLGYTDENMRSKLILIPVAQFLMENNKNPDNISDTDFQNIKQWIQLSSLAGVFGSQTSAYLMRLRNVITGKTEFPLSQIKEDSAKYGRPLQIDRERLETLVDRAQYGSQDAWVLLTLLYSNLDYRGEIYHEDHIYPYSKLTSDMKRNFGNNVANLQLLRGDLNRKKLAADPDVWIQEYCTRNNLDVNTFKRENYIPTDISLTQDNYDAYISRRREMIINHLCSVLNIAA